MSSRVSSLFRPPSDPLLYRIPGTTWVIEPSKKEIKEIKRLDALVNEAEKLYEKHGGKKFPFRGCQEPVTPLQYMDFLAHVYASYEERNVFFDVTRKKESRHDSPVKAYPKLPFEPLAVMAYGVRSKKESRELGLHGKQCGYDHTPGTFVVANGIKHHRMQLPAELRNITCARSLPEELHAQFHKENQNVPPDPYESALMQMGWYHDRLGELGYSERAVKASEAKVHDMNHHLGVYDKAGKNGLGNPNALIYSPQLWGRLITNASRGRQP